MIIKARPYRIPRELIIFILVLGFSGCSFMVGLVGRQEVSHMADKINCQLQPGYSIKDHAKHKSKGYSQFGLNFKTYRWLLIDGEFIDIYKYECVDMLYSMYQERLGQTGKKDLALRDRIKGML